MLYAKENRKGGEFMKLCSMLIGVATGIAVATATIGVMYPDVTRRMQRDGKRLLNAGKKLV